MTSSFKAAPSVPPLSAVRRVGELLFLSGQIGQSRETGTLPADVAAQAAETINNLERVLNDVGAGLSDIVRVGIYLADMADYAIVNRIYAARFAEPFPVRTAIAVAALPFGARVEMDAIALARD